MRTAALCSTVRADAGPQSRALADAVAGRNIIAAATAISTLPMQTKTSPARWSCSASARQRARLPGAVLVRHGEPVARVLPAEFDQLAREVGRKEEQAEQLAVHRVVAARNEAAEQRK